MTKLNIKGLKKLIAPALAAGLAMTVAVPAHAQYYDDPRQIRQELRQFERQVERIQHDRSVSQQNATWLSYRLRGIEDQFYRFGRGGFNDWEMSTLNHSLQIFQNELDRRTRGYRSDRGYRSNQGNSAYDRDWDDRRQDYRDDRGSRDDRRSRRGNRRDD